MKSVDFRELEKGREMALKYLSYSPRSIAEVRKHLERKRFNADLIEQLIERLIASKLLDDAQYVEQFANRALHNKKGTLWIRQSLIQKGVDAHTVHTQLTNVSAEEESVYALRLATKKKSEGHCWSKNELQKLCSNLVYRGFSVESIRITLKQLHPDSEELCSYIDSLEFS